MFRFPPLFPPRSRRALSLTFLLVCAGTARAGPPTLVAEGSPATARDEPSPAQEDLLWSEIRRNVAASQSPDVVVPPDNTVTYAFPLRMAAGVPDSAGFRGSAFFG